MEQFRATHARFLSTRWSMVLTARASDDAAAAEAMEHLCRTYHPPVYSFLRRRGLEPHDAEDVAQSFFAHLLGRPFLQSVAPEHGPFRTFLLTALDRFLINHRRHGAARKRGGTQPALSLDQDGFEVGQEASEQDTAGFDRDWAATIVRAAFAQLAAECQQAGKEALFEELQRHLIEGDEPVEAPDIARRLGCQPDAVRQARSRLRRRLRELLIAGIAETVPQPEAVDAEARYLMRAWSCGAGG